MKRKQLAAALVKTQKPVPPVADQAAEQMAKSAVPPPAESRQVRRARERRQIKLADMQVNQRARSALAAQKIVVRAPRSQ